MLPGMRRSVLDRARMEVVADELRLRESLRHHHGGPAVTAPDIGHLGAAFQFRAEDTAPLAFLAITMPPWPGMEEAVAVEGPWTPTVRAGR